MADEQQQQGQGPWRPPTMLQSRTSIVQDDYRYEPKAVPKPSFLEGQPQQQGGMAPQFEIVTGGINNNA